MALPRLIEVKSWHLSPTMSYPRPLRGRSFKSGALLLKIGNGQYTIYTQAIQTDRPDQIMKTQIRRRTTERGFQLTLVMMNTLRCHAHF